MSCKLYLVPEDVINSWRSEQREKAIDLPVNTVTSQIDSKMSSILKNDMTDYDKEKLYAQELDRLRTLRNQKALPAVPTVMSSKNISLSTIPLLYQKRADALLDYLKSKGVSWDERGQVKIGDQVLERSNILDLVSDAVRLRKMVKRPTGWREMSAFLDKSNVPRELVGNPEWIKDETDAESTDDTITQESDFDDFHDAEEQLKPKRKKSLPRKAKETKKPKVEKWVSLKS